MIGPTIAMALLSESVNLCGRRMQGKGDIGASGCENSYFHLPFAHAREPEMADAVRRRRWSLS